MSYNPKTNWQNSEIVNAVDMNRIEQGISDLDDELNSRTEHLYNPNLLVNCDDFVINTATIDVSSNTSFNVKLNNTQYEGNGFAPKNPESSGYIEMRYQIMGTTTPLVGLPMTLQVRFGERVAPGTGITIKTYVFNETGDEFTETTGLVTWRITLTGYSAKIYWTKAANVSSDYMIAGAKLELGNVPTRFDLSNTLGKTIDVVWTESKNRFETKSNKVTSISSNSTDNEYPSANAVYSLLNKLRIGSENPNWKNTASGNMQWYFYESANTTTLDLPTANCIVVVFNTGPRGVAFAFGWEGVSTNKNIWKNTCHDVWRGWVSLHSN